MLRPLVLVVAALGCLTSSDLAGAEGRRWVFSSIVLPGLIAVVVAMIFDMMHSRQRFIGVGQQPLVELQQSIAPRGG